jgi:hypothetical protein
MLTGEPDAGNLHVRFGGRGGANQCAIPTPYHPSPICVMELLKPRPPDAPVPACLGGSARCG